MCNIHNKNGDYRIIWVCLGCIIYLILFTAYNVYIGTYSKRDLSDAEHVMCEQLESEVGSYSRDEVVCVNGFRFSRL